MVDEAGLQLRDNRQFLIGLGDDGECAFVRAKYRVQSLRFAERVAHERGGAIHPGQ